MTPDQLLVGSGVVLGAALWLRRGSTWGMDVAKPPPIGPRGPLTNLLYPMRDPIHVGTGTVDFYEKHMALRAMSGGFKTTLLAQLVRQRLDAGRSCVVMTGGDSDQLEEEIKAHGGWVIRPHDSQLTFNAFEGTASYKAQGWAGLFPTNSDAKVYHSAFEIVAIRYFESTSRYSVRGMMDFMLNYDPDNDDQEGVVLEGGKRMPKLNGRLWKGMREGYVGIRLQLMDMAFGDWIGDQLSILDCARRGIPIMFVVDSADDPDLNRFAAALVWQAINYAIRERGHLDVFVDELGRLPLNLVGDHVRTWRRNDSHLVVGSDKDSDFSEILDDLIHLQALGTMVASAADTRSGASEKTWGLVHPTNFGAHVIQPRYTIFHKLLHRPRQGGFWLVDLERVQQVRVTAYSPPKKRKPRWSMDHLSATAKRTPPTGSGSAVTKKDRAPAVPRSTAVVPPKGGNVVRGAWGDEGEREEAEEGTKRELRVVATNAEPLPAWANEQWLASMYRECRRTGIPAILFTSARGTWIDERGCLEWQGSYWKARGPWRPRKNVGEGRGGVTPYREFVRAAGRNPSPTCDHLCGNPACCEEEHIEGGVSFEDNKRREGPRAEAFSAAGWQQVAGEHFDSCPADCDFQHMRWRPVAVAEGVAS